MCQLQVNEITPIRIILGFRVELMSLNVSVRIDVDQLLADREAERAEAEAETQALGEEPEIIPKPPRKRKSDASDAQPKAKKAKIKSAKVAGKNPEGSALKVIAPKVTLKLGPPKPKESDAFPCCLCVSQSLEGLLRVQDPPTWRKEGGSGLPGQESVWMAHEACANVIPETWVDEEQTGAGGEGGSQLKEKLVFGVGSIVKDRWNLV